MKKIISYNVNGIRSATKKGLLDWIRLTDPDIICFQELKAEPEKLDAELLSPPGYHTFWNPATRRKGYSGVGIWSKEKPLHVEYGCGIEKYDEEGRFLRADFKDFSILSLYLPSGSSGEERQDFKDIFLVDFLEYVKELKKKFPRLIISGDYNICHKPIDIHNPVSNKNSSGFLEHERAWVSEFLEQGFIDTFRHFNPEPNHYTWWSFRANARNNNKGWRIDYHMVTNELLDKCLSHTIHAGAIHSDHCPIELVIS